MAETPVHIPVMLDRTLELLAPALEREGAVLVDATLGLGGHAEAALERHAGLTLVGLDRDTDALARAGERLARFGDRVHLVHTVYSGLRTALDGLGIESVSAVLFDLGVSSMQLDQAEGGFAYAQDAPLDMRMDRTRGVTAASILAEYPEDELRRIFYAYGEEKLAPRYARRIVQARAEHPIERSSQLVDLIAQATPRAVQRAGHPAKRVFQALRIEVNGELEARTRSTAPSGLPIELPEHRPEFALLVRGAELADDAERARNPRAVPVRLRAAERVREAA